MAETNHEKFVRIRDTRLPNALKAIALLGNLGNAKNYDYSGEEARDMIRQLRAAVEEVASEFGIGPVSPLVTTTRGPEIAADAAPVPVAPETPAPVARPVYGATAPLWATVRDMAEQCPLDELSLAMTIYLSRVDDELFDRRKRT